MNTPIKVAASLLALSATGFLAKTAHAVVPHVVAVQDVCTEDPTAFATWIGKINQVAKAKLGIDPYIRVYVTSFDSEKYNAVRAVTSAASVVELTKNSHALGFDEAISDAVAHLDRMSQRGARVLFQSVRHEGVYRNGWLYWTNVKVSDEDAYLKALDRLRTLFDSHGFQDAKLNCNRVLVGKSDFTHRVSIALPSVERLAAFLDFAASDSELAAWLVSVSSIRTVVTNGTAHDITE